MGELHEAEIRARIKEARKEAGLSQSTMADLLGVIPRTVQNYENDHVPWSRIRDIADITGKSTRWLLHGDDSEEAVAQPDVLEQLANVKATLGRIERAVENLVGLASSQGAKTSTAQTRKPAASTRRKRAA